jgi:hypothetical protein
VTKSATPPHRPPDLSDDEVVALMEQFTKALRDGATADAATQDAFDALTGWMLPRASRLFYRLYPHLAQAVSPSEIGSDLAVFLLTGGATKYLEYREEKIRDGVDYLRPVHYLFTRTGNLATLFRRLVIRKGQYGGEEAFIRRAQENVKRTIHRMCRDGRLVEFGRTSGTSASEIWQLQLQPRPNDRKPYSERRFLRGTDSASAFVIGLDQWSVEQRLEVLVTTSIGVPKSSTGRSWPEWILQVFDCVPAPFPLKGTTLLALVRACTHSVALDAAELALARSDSRGKS